MKKLFLLFVMALSVTFFAPEAQASLSAPSSTTVEAGVVPNGKGVNKKEVKQRLKKAEKQYKAETKGMTKAEKQAFLEDKIEKEAAVPRMQILIIGIILLLVGALLMGIFWSSIYWLGSIIATIGFIIIIVWLILWLMDMA